MPISSPVLDGTQLPRVSEYSEKGGYRGGSTLLVNGGVAFDNVNTNYKRTFVLVWRGLRSEDKETILGKYAVIKNGSAIFVPPKDNTEASEPTIYVTRSDQQAEMEWKATAVGGGTLLLWEATMMLREV
jgi:hypothetical protein